MRAEARAPVERGTALVATPHDAPLARSADAQRERRLASAAAEDARAREALRVALLHERALHARAMRHAHRQVCATASSCMMANPPDPIPSPSPYPYPPTPTPDHL